MESRESQHTNDLRAPAARPGGKFVDVVWREVSGVCQPGYKFWSYPFLLINLDKLIFVNLSLLLCKTGTITISTSWNTDLMNQ